MYDFRGRHILITGASRGLGAAMAECLAARGAQLSLLARSGAELDALAERLRHTHGARAAPCVADVTDHQALAHAVRLAEAELGPLYGVLANAGYVHPARFVEMPPSEVAGQVSLNLSACLATVRVVLPGLVSRGAGFVAVTSSPAGSASIYGFSVYGATKAGLNYFSRALRHELRGTGVGVHLLLPPDTDTPGYQYEVTLYPHETKALLAGGTLYPAARVAERMVTGIAAGHREITIGWEPRLAMGLARYAPAVWEGYVRWATRRS